MLFLMWLHLSLITADPCTAEGEVGMNCAKEEVLNSNSDFYIIIENFSCTPHGFTISFTYNISEYLAPKQICVEIHKASGASGSLSCPMKKFNFSASSDSNTFNCSNNDAISQSAVLDLHFAKSSCSGGYEVQILQFSCNFECRVPVSTDPAEPTTLSTSFKTQEPFPTTQTILDPSVTKDTITLSSEKTKVGTTTFINKSTVTWSQQTLQSTIESKTDVISATFDANNSLPPPSNSMSPPRHTVVNTFEATENPENVFTSSSTTKFVEAEATNQPRRPMGDSQTITIVVPLIVLGLLIVVLGIYFHRCRKKRYQNRQIDLTTSSEFGKANNSATELLKSTNV